MISYAFRAAAKKNLQNESGNLSVVNILRTKNRWGTDWSPPLLSSSCQGLPCRKIEKDRTAESSSAPKSRSWKRLNGEAWDDQKVSVCCTPNSNLTECNECLRFVKGFEMPREKICSTAIQSHDNSFETKIANDNC